MDTRPSLDPPASYAPRLELLLYVRLLPLLSKRPARCTALKKVNLGTKRERNHEAAPREPSSSTTVVSGCNLALRVRLHRIAKSTRQPVTSIVVSPTAVSPAPNAKIQFTAAIQGTTTNTSVIWTSSIGSITSPGILTAPTATGTTGVIVATSVADPTKTATVAVSGYGVGHDNAIASFVGDQRHGAI